MAFPVSARTTGTLITATIWNSDLKDNINALYGGSMSIPSQATNDMIVAGSSTTLSRLAAVAGKFPRFNASSVWGMTALAVEQITSATGAQNNFSLSDAPIVHLRCTGANPVFNGFSVGGATPAHGAIVILDCQGTTARAAYQAGASTAAYRFITESVSGQIVGANGRILFVYDATVGRWTVSVLSTGSAIAFTPTWSATGTTPAIGNGTLAGFYVQRGRQVYFEAFKSIGSTTTIGTGTYSYALPPIAAANANRGVVSGHILDSGVERYPVAATLSTTTAFQVVPIAAGSALVGASTPMAWDSGDSMTVAGYYEGA